MIGQILLARSFVGVFRENSNALTAESGLVLTAQTRFVGTPSSRDHFTAARRRDRRPAAPSTALQPCRRAARPAARRCDRGSRRDRRAVAIAGQSCRRPNHPVATTARPSRPPSRCRARCTSLRAGYRQGRGGAGSDRLRCRFGPRHHRQNRDCVP
jgi:hypothetical protein